MNAEGIVTLVSKDEKRFPVSRDIAMGMELCREILGGQDEDGDEEESCDVSIEIPIPNVNSHILEKVIAFCEHMKEDPMTPIQTPLKSNQLDQIVQEWYANYVKVEKDTLFSLVAAANYLDIKQLLDLTCLAVSILIKGKSAPELREMFNISAELTAEEQAQILADNNEWHGDDVAPDVGEDLHDN